MTITLRHTATWLLLATASITMSALAQNAPAAGQDAATAAGPQIGGATAPAGVNPRVKQRRSEQQLLGAPNEYGAAGAQGADTADAQQAALLDEGRMRVIGGAPAPAKGQRKAPAGNAQGAAAAQAGGVTAAGALMPTGAARATYADPFDATGAGKHTVYRSPW
ncbi:MAG TPA: hypothetical protein VFE79_04965 [Paraburkholderia sp.]|jgi:hypothetical protein|nr:hypothetical protein [Paraburkholderia sp.]